jgi:peptidoglycan/LPS O-acetylase OafA/YrhL
VSLPLARRVAELDGLRGIAIGLVIAYHMLAPVPILKPIFGMGWSGVDLFFVLSGFLLGGLLLDQRDAPNLLKVFYTRRICRIFPLYFALIACYWLALQAPQPQFPPWVSIFASDRAIPVWSYATFTHNFYAARNLNLGANFVSATWSLAVEEQFYLILPFLIRSVSQRRLPLLLLLGIVAAPVCRFACIHLAGNPVAAYVLLPCRADALFLGVLGAWLCRSQSAMERMRRSSPGRFALVCFALVLVLNGLCPNMLDYPMATLGYTFLGVFYLSLLLLVVLDKSSRLARFCRLPGLRMLGRVSYFMYMVHHPMLQLGHALFVGETVANSQVPVGAVVVACVTMVFTLILADVSWRLFEQPIIDLGHSMTYAKKPAPP